VLVTTSGAEFPEPSGLRRASVPVEELARRKGVRPVESVDEMAQDGVFESDQELEEFLAQVYAAREADLA
jgi:hypothetical protein